MLIKSFNISDDIIIIIIVFYFICSFETSFNGIKLNFDYQKVINNLRFEKLVELKMESFYF